MINVHKTGHLFIKRDTSSQNRTLFSQRFMRLILDPTIFLKPWEIFLSRVYIYKDCMKILKEEILARNKAEEMVKVLKNTIKAKADINDDKEVVEDMDFEEEKWIEVKVKKKKIHKDCGNCGKVFNTHEEMKKHELEHVPLENLTAKNVMKQLILENHQ